MADTTAAPTGGRALFVRQSSGLVREVSVRNALFYNTAAFIGITVASEAKMRPRKTQAIPTRMAVRP